MPPPHEESCCLGAKLAIASVIASELIEVSALQHKRNLEAQGASGIENVIAKYLRQNNIVGGASKSEEMSWQVSLPKMSMMLQQAGLDRVQVFPEFKLPLTSRRVDALVAGFHPKTGEPSYACIELKQWSRATTHEGNLVLVDVPGARYSPTTHPGVQVRGYCEYMQGFYQVLHESKPVAGAAYLHNAESHNIADLWDLPPDEGAQIFAGDQEAKFVKFLQANFSNEPGLEAAEYLEKSAKAPSKKLLDAAAAEIREQEQFVLLDEQRLAYELVLEAVRKAKESDNKEIIVVSGGPGSGKSVIALSLLGELARQGVRVLHATGSKSLTESLRKVVSAGRGNGKAKELFKYFNSFMEADRNALDVLIADEAHRLRQTSVNRYTGKAIRDKARPQVEELIAAARVPVFLLDQFQIVRPGEMGSIEEITSHAEAMNLKVRVVELQDQFRCAGSVEYERWVLGLLGLGGFVAHPWVDSQNYDVQVANGPRQMEEQLASRSQDGTTARMTAGYCWPWTRELKNGNLADDVAIGDWARPWNSWMTKNLGDIPPSSLWASLPGGAGQVGCIYTAQGFEYDHNAVIFGGDLVRRNGEWVINRDANKDPDLKNRNKVSDDEFYAKVLNVYKVLLTRGMKSCLLYSVDAETQAYFEALAPRLSE